MSGSIWTWRPFSDGQICTKIASGSKEISIACDDSCGTLKHLTRSEIALFDGDEEVTYTIFPDMDVVSGTVENLRRALDWLEGI